MPSAKYKVVREAILHEQQITCVYQRHYRELCPHIIGWTDGEERLLAYQFAGKTSGALPPHGAWKCLDIAEMTDVKLRGGRWHAGDDHRRTQTCVTEIDLDINVHVRVGAR
jgi:hypothetical protein